MTDTVRIAIPELDLPEAVLRLSLWHRQDGRYVREGDRLLEMVAGDVVVDLTAPADGQLHRLAVEDDIVAVGQVVGVIEVNTFS